MDLNKIAEIQQGLRAMNRFQLVDYLISVSQQLIDMNLYPHNRQQLKHELFAVRMFIIDSIPDKQ